MTFEFMGVTVFRNTETSRFTGTFWKYSARTSEGYRHANTRQGIKELIREAVGA